MCGQIVLGNTRVETGWHRIVYVGILLRLYSTARAALSCLATTGRVGLKALKGTKGARDVYGANAACLGTNQAAVAGYHNSVYNGWANNARQAPGWPGHGVGTNGMRDHARQRRRFAHPDETLQVAEHWGGLPTTAQGGKLRVF